MTVMTRGMLVKVVAKAVGDWKRIEMQKTVERNLERVSEISTCLTVMIVLQLVWPAHRSLQRDLAKCRNFAPSSKL